MLCGTPVWGVGKCFHRRAAWDISCLAPSFSGTSYNPWQRRKVLCPWIGCSAGKELRRGTTFLGTLRWGEVTAQKVLWLAQQLTLRFELAHRCVQFAPS